MMNLSSGSAYRRQPRVLITAGEISGDVHAAAVISVLRSLWPEVSIHGVAGRQMQQQGCLALHEINELNVMGIGDVLRALPRIRRIEKNILSWAEKNRPSVAVLVDFPGFHMRLGCKLRKMGIPVIQYIAPKLWAWGSWRSQTLKQSQDRLASIFPFEEEWFSRHDIQAEYVGNPSAVTCSGGWSASELKQRLGVPSASRLLALLPGSRRREIVSHLGLLLQVWKRISELHPKTYAVVPVAPGVDASLLQPLADAGVFLIDRAAPGYALRADAAVAVSGTATLELALWGVPTVLVYRSSAVWMHVARRLVHLNCAGLANILLGDRPVMPELIQHDCTVDNMMHSVMPLLRGETAAEKQRQEFSRLRQLLGKKDPALGVAHMVLEMAE